MAVAHGFNPRTWNAEAGRSLWVPGEPRVHSDTLSQKKSKELLGHDVIQGMEKSHEIKGTGIGGVVADFTKMEGKLGTSGHWEGIQPGKEKQLNHQGQSLLVMVITKEGILQLDGSFPVLNSEPPFPLGHLTVAVNLKNLNSSSF